MTDPALPLPLSGTRVLDLADGRVQGIGRLLADLGADVIRVEPSEGAADRHRGVVDDGVSLTFLVRNANKASALVEVSDLHRLGRLCSAADIVLVTPDATPYDMALIRNGRATNPALVVLEVTDFGLTGPKRAWIGTPDVQFALSSVLSRSGLPEVTEPLLPPEFLAYESAVAQAAWATVLAHYQALRTGRGDDVDFSVFEALIQVLDPGMGIGGSARAGAPMRDLPRGRPDARHLYPIFPATDGWVRICVLSPRQWQGMFTWLGEPAEFADPKFNNIGVRFAAAGTLYPLIGRLFSGLTREEATQAGQALGVPVAGVASASEVLATDAFQQAGSFAKVDLPDGRSVTVPTGVFEIDGQRSGLRTPAPAIGSAEDAFTVDHAARPTPVAAPRTQPFDGLRVLDLGVIVVGAELGRVFADHGADVIKIESRAFPDGSRQSFDGSEMTEGFAWGHRNKRSLGLNLKSDEGRRLFRDLIGRSDVMLTNFKPGTLDSLGFGWKELQRLNPRLVLSESSAFGNAGPWSRRLGYGPLVRAGAGLSALWRYPHIEGSFSDAITIFPDHVVARLNAAAVTALLARRHRTGRGGRVSTAQIDAIFSAMADLIALESLRPGSIRAERTPLDAPLGLFATAGDDDWLVVDGVGTDRFRGLATTIGRDEWLDDSRFSDPAGRLAHAAELAAGVAAWAATQGAADAAKALQEAGVPAGNMVRITEFETDPHLRERGFFGRMHQPQFADAMPAMQNEARFDNLPDPLLDPAPLMAEHTAEIAAEVLGLGPEQIEQLLDSGALEIHPSKRPSTATV
jgi:crotonobetainyl-CoA:carnitine CoA-transferase CaiB-like acyl-CoA transferase